MRLLIICIFLIVNLGFGIINNPNQEKLDGKWIPVRQEFAGSSLPSSSFEKQTLVINDSMYVVTAESVDKGTLKYSDGKMDIFGKDGINSGKHFTAIYKLDKEQLTICYNLKGDVYPASYETKGHPMFFLSVFKKSDQ
ncbi:MAG: TIGR03067 domain-containing protein [Chitinophagaceae bacterium]